MTTPITNMLKGVALGAICAATLAAIGGYIASLSGWLVFTAPVDSPLLSLWYWVYNNLRLSLIPFSLIAVAYLHAIIQLKQALGITPTDANAVQRYEQWVDVHTSLFFGVGVIWTAIGMRSALLQALGGLDAESAASMGAFTILQRLIDGGVLLSLSTTIVGGVGGYLMRLLKSQMVGRQLNTFYQNQFESPYAQITNQLKRIEQLLAKQPTTISASAKSSQDSYSIAPAPTTEEQGQ